MREFPHGFGTQADHPTRAWRRWLLRARRVAGRRYEVVSDREGGVTIESPITPAAELHARRGTKPASAEDFERLSVDVPFDDEG